MNGSLKKIQEEIKKNYLDKWQWKHHSKVYGIQQKQFKREIYSNTILPQETRKTSNRQPHFTPKTTGKRRTTKKKKKHQKTELVEGKKS